MSNMNLSPDKINQLLKLAGKQLGQDPEDLRKKLEKGDAQTLLNGLDPKSQQKINQVLQNPQALNQLMQNEQVKNLLGKIMKP